MTFMWAGKCVGCKVQEMPTVYSLASGCGSREDRCWHLCCCYKRADGRCWHWGGRGKKKYFYPRWLLGLFNPELSWERYWWGPRSYGVREQGTIMLYCATRIVLSRDMEVCSNVYGKMCSLNLFRWCGQALKTLHLEWKGCGFAS